MAICSRCTSSTWSKSPVPLVASIRTTATRKCSTWFTKSKFRSTSRSGPHTSASPRTEQFEAARSESRANNAHHFQKDYRPDCRPSFERHGADRDGSQPRRAGGGIAERDAEPVGGVCGAEHRRDDWWRNDSYHVAFRIAGI